MSAIENIGKRDVLWSYVATFFSVGAGIILLPFMLNRMSAETIGIWTLYQTVILLTFMLDFGFRPSFARNISYIFSGVRNLQAEGVETSQSASSVDYALLKGALITMKRFYQWIALATLLLLGTAGTLYFYTVFSHYEGNQTDAWFSWVLLVLCCSWDLYSFYYDALMTGKGYIRRMQQISIIGQSSYLLIAIGLIFAGCGLSAIVGARFVSIIIKRVMMYRTFFSPSLRLQLEQTQAADTRDILSAISPNAIKMGLVGVGGYIINYSATWLGGLLLPLEVMASYGITMQVISILARCSQVYCQSYLPKLAQCRVERDLPQLRRLFFNSEMSLVTIFLLGGMAFVLLGNWALGIIHSETTFLPTALMIALLVVQLLEQNHSLAASFIMADNKIPFFIPSLLSAAGTLVLLFVFFYGFPQSGVWALILAPGIAQLCYQNWKWPSVVIKELYLQK